MSEQPKSIAFPKINWEQQPIPFTCRRSIRNGGFLLQQEEFHDKHLIHSYGQGGAQFSLSFGNAYLTNKMLTMRQHPTQIHEVAVLGAGITGLVTALELLKTGYKVKLYADKFPKMNEKDPSKRLGSQQGLQFWYPSFYDIDDPVRHEFVCKIAYRLFKECLTQNKYRSIKKVDCFISGPQAQVVTEVVSEFITKDIKQEVLNFGNNKPQKFLCFKTFLIDTDLFIEQIFIELKLRKVELIQKKFEKASDIQNLKEKSIYNCLSYGSRQVFNDQNLYPLVGHYAKFTLDNPVQQSFIIWKSAQDQLQEDVIITVSGKTVQIGSSWEKHQQNLQIKKEVIQRIILNAKQYINQRSVEKI